MSDLRELKPIWVTVKETKRLIPVGTTKLYELIGSGRLESCLLGRRRMISYASIERLGRPEPIAA
jgi:hypothetical protein